MMEQAMQEALEGKQQEEQQGMKQLNVKLQDTKGGQESGGQE